MQEPDELDRNPLGSGDTGSTRLSRDGGRNEGWRTESASTEEEGQAETKQGEAVKKIQRILCGAGFISLVIGGIWISDCRRFADNGEKLQNCYTFGIAVMGSGVGLSSAKSDGFAKGFNTYNPYLHDPRRREGK